FFIEWGDYRLDGEAIARRRFDERHITQADQRHVQGTRDRRSGKGQSVDILADFFQALFIGYAEALLFVDDHQAQVLEAAVFRKKAMRADYDIDLAGFERREDLLLLSGSAKAAEHLDTHGKGGEAALEGFIM